MRTRTVRKAAKKVSPGRSAAIKRAVRKAMKERCDSTKKK